MSLPWFFAIAPLVWSVAALARVGKPRSISPRYERLLTDDEESQLLGAMAEIWINNPDPHEPRKVRVLDAPVPYAAVCGDTIVLTPEILRSPALAAVIAHELSHLNSSDPWLRMALSRLGSDRSVFNFLRFDEVRGVWKLLAVVTAPVRWLLRLARGGIGRTMLCGAWSNYWLGREIAADVNAVYLGQGRLLAAYLKVSAQQDREMSRFLAAMSDHPPAEERIERLNQLVQARETGPIGGSPGSATHALEVST